VAIRAAREARANTEINFRNGGSVDGELALQAFKGTQAARVELNTSQRQPDFLNQILEVEFVNLGKS